jgi:hypothetical protein
MFVATGAPGVNSLLQHAVLKCSVCYSLGLMRLVFSPTQ